MPASGFLREGFDMLIIEVMGGLGNQLQQYALYQKMKSLGKEAKLDISWFFDEKRQESVLASRRLELNYFIDLPMEICTRQEKERLIGKDGLSGRLKRKLLPSRNRHFRESGMYHPEIFELEDQYLTGFWACEKYYADIMPELRRLIVFPGEECADAQELKCETDWQKNESRLNISEKEMDCQSQRTESGNKLKTDAVDINYQTICEMKRLLSVSIHIRRGDYLDPENAAMFGGICTESYYDAAIRYMEERCPGAHYYIFSDDIPYVRERYRGERFTVVDWNTGENSFLDIQLMKNCRHNICANSTFSFWGARLNGNPDKIMIRPAKHKNSQQIIPEEMHKLWENWVLIDEKGRLI